MTSGRLTEAVRSILAAPAWTSIAPHPIRLVHWREGPDHRFVPEGWIAAVLSDPGRVNHPAHHATSAELRALEELLLNSGHVALGYDSPQFEPVFRIYGAAIARLKEEPRDAVEARLREYLETKGASWRFWVHPADLPPAPV